MESGIEACDPRIPRLIWLDKLTWAGPMGRPEGCWVIRLGIYCTPTSPTKAGEQSGILLLVILRLHPRC